MRVGATIRFLLVVLGLVGLMEPANAACTAFPYTLTNGSSADASQVMANFNYLLTCVNSASPPGGPAGGALSGTYPNPSLAAGSSSNLHEWFGTSGNFTIPVGVSSSTVFKFTIIGGGGGGGGVSNVNGAAAGGGASGQLFICAFSGFSAGQTITISYGAFGVGGSSSGGSGGVGGNTTLTYNSIVFAQAGGGSGGFGSTSGTATVMGGSPGGGSSEFTVSGTGLTLVFSAPYPTPGSAFIAPSNLGGIGVGSTTFGFSGSGGPSLFGTPGSGTLVSTGGNTYANALSPGAGGGGAASKGAGAYAGGAGNNGAVLIEWLQ